MLRSEILPPTSRDEHELRVFKNRVLSGVSGCERADVYLNTYYQGNQFMER